ncbi:type II secretion system F family protein [Indiicoccus explosivorum]|uniref:type II secretion system F family protein n=1 Tax=Indiicoccus explosivorum TaxID=1917864 RepID=UPI000B44003C|nr:type II secretion system F family protein [Indiicoccus explosivorum]
MAVIAFAGVFSCCFLLLLFISSLKGADGPEKAEKDPVTLKALAKSANDMLKGLLVRKKKKPSKKRDGLEQRLNAAGLPMKAEEFIAFQGIAVLIGGGLLYVVTHQLPLFLIGGLIGYSLPGLMLKNKQQKRIKQFNEGLPAMISSLTGSLRAGFSFLQGLQMVAEEAHSPVKEEVEYVLKTMQYGTSLEDALIDWKNRMPSGDLDLLVEAILIQRQVGGNLAYLLDKILETTRERIRMENQIKTLTAQGKMSGMVIGLLPVGVGGLIYVINPAYISVLFTDPIGRMLLMGAGVSAAIGFFFIRKITTIEV